MRELWSQLARSITPYVPGEQPKEGAFIKLNTNENPYPPSPKAVEAIRAAAGDALRLYPDPDCTALRQSIAALHGLEPEQVFVGNGSDEVLALCFQAFFTPRRTVLFPDITYSFYPVYCDLFDLSYQEVPLDGDFRVNTAGLMGSEGGVVLANPNAPTSLSLPLAEVETLAEGNRNVAVLVDEAYVDFGGQSAVGLIARHPNLVVIRTLSKSYGLAGLRVGYALGDAGMIAAVNAIKNSFNSYTVDRLAQAGAQAAVEDRAYFNETVEKVIRTREWTAERLKSMGFRVFNSDANFLFITHPAASAKKLLDGLRGKDILVRWWNRPRIANCLRVSIGTDREMERFCATAQELLKQ